MFAANPASAAELLLEQPSVCRIGDELAFRAERALGRPLAEAADMRFTVHIARAGDAFEARLELLASGVVEPRIRSFHARSCEKLTDTLSLAIVLAAVSAEDSANSREDGTAQGQGDATRLAEGTDRNGSGPNGIARVQARPELDAGAVAENASSRVAWRGSLQAGAVADAGTLPSGFGTWLALSLGGEALEGRLLGTYLPARKISLSAAGAAGAELALSAGSLLGCAPRFLTSGRVALGACAGAELGWHWGSGKDVSMAKHGGALWSALRAEIDGSWRIGPRWLSLVTQIAALVPLGRHEFTLSEQGRSLRVYEPAALAGRISLGLSAEWGAGH